MTDMQSLMILLSEKNTVYWEKQFQHVGKQVGKEEIVRTEDFQYVVERKEQDRVCFLSGQERFPVSKRKLPSGKMLGAEETSAIARSLNKIRSNRGVGGLADIAPRFPKASKHEVPPPNKYTIYQKPIQENIYPFGKCSLQPLEYINKTPGPGAYESAWQCRRPRKKHTFGGRMRLDPCVECICVPKAIDECNICQKVCVGDYWHIDYSLFICLRCMRIQRKTQSKFTKTELNRFKKIRNCSFMHQHEGTTAAVRLHPKRELCTKFRKENYLDLFFNKYI